MRFFLLCLLFGTTSLFASTDSPAGLVDYSVDSIVEESKITDKNKAIKWLSCFVANVDMGSEVHRQCAQSIGEGFVACDPNLDQPSSCIGGVVQVGSMCQQSATLIYDAVRNCNESTFGEPVVEDREEAGKKELKRIQESK